MVDSVTDSAADRSDTLKDPVTNEVRQAFQIANFFILCFFISLFGICSNIVNICVFAKQGFKDSINISLMGLAISDLASSLTMFWGSVFFCPLFTELDVPIAPLEVTYMAASMPHICFNRITSVLTAFITLERCLCIAMPLKVKLIITPLRTKIINVFIFVLLILLCCPFYFVHRLEWRFAPSRNRSILGIVFLEGREIVDSVMFFTHSVLLSSFLLLTVIVCTTILVVKLNEKTKWRNDSIAQTTSKEDKASVKDKKVVKMITLIAIIFIVCYIPPTINFLIMSYNADFSVNGRLQNILYVVWSMTFVLQALNSSVNIFVYFKMSSKFKDTFYEIFRRRTPGK